MWCHEWLQHHDVLTACTTRVQEIILLGDGRMRTECFRDSAPGLSKGCYAGLEVWAVLASLEARHAACKVLESAPPSPPGKHH